MSRAALLAATLVAACQTAPSPEATPAVLTQMTPALHGQLERLITRATGRQTRLSRRVLMDEPLVTVEPVPVGEGQSYRGRPPRFELIKRGEKCILTGSNDEQSWTLEDADCRAVKP